MMFKYKVIQDHLSSIEMAIQAYAVHGWRVHSFEPYNCVGYDGWFACLMEQFIPMRDNSAASHTETNEGMPMKG